MRIADPRPPLLYQITREQFVTADYPTEDPAVEELWTAAKYRHAFRRFHRLRLWQMRDTAYLME